MKAVILCRVSTSRQEEEGLSLDHQEKTLTDYAKAQGFEVVEIFRFSESADSKIRNKFNEMIQFVKNRKDVNAIIAYRVDRITRNFRDAVLMDELRNEYGKVIHFVYDRLVIDNKTFGGKITDWDTKVYLAKQTINRLKEDGVISAKYKIKKGELPYKAPYGYTNIEKEDKTKWVEIEPFRAMVVKKMYEWYGNESCSFEQVRVRLKKELNVDFAKGKIDYILKHPFYCGEIHYEGQIFYHKYEIIIPKELWNKVQAKKAGYRKQPFKFAGLLYAYRGLMRCSQCGCSITPEKKKGKFTYYHCTEYHGKHNAEWVREEDITKQFDNLFKSIRVPEKTLNAIVSSLKQAHVGKIEYLSEIREKLQYDHNMLQNRLEKMYEDKLDGRITQDMYDNKYKEYREKQEGILTKLNSMQGADEEYYITAERLLDLANRAYELFQRSESEQKRQLLSLVLQNCQLKGRELVYELKKPFDSILTCSKSQIWLPLIDVFRTGSYLQELYTVYQSMKQTNAFALIS